MRTKGCVGDWKKPRVGLAVGCGESIKLHIWGQCCQIMEV